MIRSFRSKALRRLVEQGDASKLSVSNVRRVETIVARLDAAMVPEDSDEPPHPTKAVLTDAVRVKARCAIPALQGMVLAEGALNHM